MKRFIISLIPLSLYALPVIASAQEASASLDMAITLGYYLSTLGFLLASVMMGLAVMEFGRSALGSIFTYFFIGTATFLVVTVFQTLGADFFGIADESVDIWWHLMFYLALISYFLGLKALVGLGSTDSSHSTFISGMAQIWAMAVTALLFAFFVIPSMTEPIVSAYNASAFSAFGLHHFLAFLLAGTVGFYLLNAKKNIGQIGRAIATPMIVSVWALSLQHLCQLSN